MLLFGLVLMAGGLGVLVMLRAELGIVPPGPRPPGPIQSWFRRAWREAGRAWRREGRRAWRKAQRTWLPRLLGGPVPRTQRAGRAVGRAAVPGSPATEHRAHGRPAGARVVGRASPPRAGTQPKRRPASRPRRTH